MGYIDQDILINDMHKFWSDVEPVWNEWEKTVNDGLMMCLISLIRIQPTVQMRPMVQGKWKKGDMPTYGGWKCSECGENTVLQKPRFCPNCGAEMWVKNG